MPHTAETVAAFSAEKRRVALHSMLAAAVMTLLKLAAGLVSVWTWDALRPIASAAAVAG